MVQIRPPDGWEPGGDRVSDSHIIDVIQDNREKILPAGLVSIWAASEKLLAIVEHPRVFVTSVLTSVIVEEVYSWMVAILDAILAVSESVASLPRLTLRALGQGFEPLGGAAFFLIDVYDGILQSIATTTGPAGPPLIALFGLFALATYFRILAVGAEELPVIGGVINFFKAD